MTINDIYKIFVEEVASIDFACEPGCFTCCTRSVNLTTGEGRLIMDFLREEGRELPELPEDASPLRPALTTNELSALYLSGKEEIETEGNWLFEPCFFLVDGLCTIYPVRPFACRSMGSTVNCSGKGEACAPDWFITLVVIINQVLEDYDRPGYWGNMADILAFLTDQTKREVYRQSGRLLANRPIPGFLLLPEERDRVQGFLAKIGWQDQI